MIMANAPYLWYIMVWFLCVLTMIWWRFLKVKHRSQVSITKKNSSLLIRHWSLRIFFIKHILLTGAVFFLALALLRPQKEGEDEEVNHEGRDLIIALDISRSMLAEEPARLARAKEKISQLVQQLGYDRVALILFSGTALVMCPLTADHEAFALFLRDVDVETISSGTTALDQALTTITAMIDRSPQRKHRLALLVTDGEDFSPLLTQAKDEVIKRGIHMVTLGIGSPQGAPIPRYDAAGNREGHVRDEQGNVVISRLNEPLLQTLARDSHALYVRTTEDTTDIATIVGWLKSFEKEDLGLTKRTVKYEYYAYPTMVSFLLFMVEWII
jgi:Ca-activated chloride channel homolog